MDDALLVSRAVGGDLDSFGQLYDRYFGCIYDFCLRVTRDADEAADATRDVFAIALLQLSELSRASSFKSWVFTIAHNTAVTRAESGGRAPLTVPSHDEAFGTFDAPDPSRLGDPALATGDHELAALVWEAASALNPRDYALLDLHVRQGLESAEIARVLGVAKGTANTTVTRMKAAAGAVINSYVVARRGSKDCDDLRHVLAAHTFPPFSDDVRRAVDAHVEGCEKCRRSRAALVAPLLIFGSFAAVSAPFALKGEAWREISSSWPQSGGNENLAQGLPPPEWRGEAIAAAGGAGGGTGAPGPTMDGGDEGNRIVLFAVAVLGLLVFAFAIAGGLILAGSAGGGDDGGGGPGVSTRTSIARTPSTQGVVVETPTIDPNATATPTPEPDTPTPEPTTPPTPVDTPTLEPDTPTATRTPRGFRTPTPEDTATPEGVTPTPTP